MDDINDNALETNKNIKEVNESEEMFLKLENELTELLSKEKNKKLIEELYEFKMTIKKSNLSQEDEIKLTSKTDKHIAEIEKKVYSDLLWDYKKEKLSSNLIKELEGLEKKVKNSLMPYSEKDKLLNEINNLITETYRTTSINDLKITTDEIKKEIKIEVDEGIFFIVLPKLGSGYEYIYELYDGNNLVDKGVTDEFIELSKIDKKTSFNLNLEVVDSRNKIELLKLSTTVIIDDTEAPVIEYAYVEDSVLYMSYKDNLGFGKEPLIYQIEGGKEIKTSKSSIEVKIPFKITVTVVDLFGNKVTQTFDIKEDNVVLMGNPSKKKVDELEKKKISKVERYEDLKNVVVVEFGKKANLLKELEDLSIEKFGVYNEGDVTISSNSLTTEENGFVSFNKEGIHEVKLNHSFYTKDSVSIYVLVKGNSILYTNIDKINVNNPYLVYEDNVSLSRYLTYDLVKEGYNAKTDFIFAKKIGETEVFPISKNLELDKNIINSFEIIDFYTGDRFYIDLKLIEKEELISASYKDVTYKHWAYHDIKDLTLKQLIRGYPDKTFKPNNNITVKEFMTILSRFMANQPIEKSQSVKNNVEPNLMKNDWSYIEVKSIINKIDENKLNSFNITDLNRKITREEVAFIISNVVNLEENENSNITLKDIYNSKYILDVYKLSNAGVITGYPDKTFKPKNNITRAEIVAMLNRLDKMNE